MNELNEARELYASARLSEAEAKLRRDLASNPADGRAKVLLGVIYAKTRRYGLANQLLVEVLEEFPDQFDSLVWLAIVKKATSDYEGAIALCRRAIDVNPTDPAAYNALGLSYLSVRRSGPALDAFREAIKRAPKSAPAYFNLGLALRLRDDSYGACHAFARAIELDPNSEANYMQLYRQQLLISAWHDAILNLEAGLRRFPNSVPIADALGWCYCRVNQRDKGEALFKRVAKIKPGTCQSYAMWLQEEGRFEDSVALLNESLVIEPVQGAAYYCLAEAKAFESDDGSTLIERASAIASQPALKRSDRMYLAYALGKAYDHAKQYRLAIENFNLANDLAFDIFNEGRRLDFDVERTTNQCLVDLYTSEFLTEHRSHGSGSQTPILIVGMIRSGTTLLDQILSSHPLVTSAGEQPFWKLEGPRVTTKWHNRGVDVKDIGYLHKNYLTVLNSVAGVSSRITDKMPLNYEFLGLIHTVFPSAKFLHIRRNPVDTCLSIYMTHFGGGPNFAYRQENIVFHYREYLRLMEHWRKVLPEGCFFELDYEDLVADQEGVTRELIEFCGLPWDDACLHHDQNNSTVSTPSRWQARQPIYRTSVEKWRNYEPWLGSILELRDLAHPMTHVQSQA